MIVTRVERYCIKKNNKYYSLIDDFCFKSKNLYNHANYIIRQEYIQNKRGKENEEFILSLPLVGPFNGNRKNSRIEGKTCAG